MQKNLNIEKINFKVVQIKFLAMHINNQKISFDIFTVRNVQNIFMEHEEKMIILTHTMYFCLLLQIYPSDWFCAPGSHISMLTPVCRISSTGHFKQQLICEEVQLAAENLPDLAAA